MPTNKAPADYANIAGMSDEAVKAKTGWTWDKWVWALDRVKYKIEGWWAQTVTVGYERMW